MPFIGGSENDFTDTLKRVDDELGANKALRPLNSSPSAASCQESAFFLPYPHPTIVDMQYVSHVERAVASAMCHGGCAAAAACGEVLQGLRHPKEVRQHRQVALCLRGATPLHGEQERLLHALKPGRWEKSRACVLTRYGYPAAVRPLLLQRQCGEAQSRGVQQASISYSGGWCSAWP